MRHHTSGPWGPYPYERRCNQPLTVTWRDRLGRRHVETTHCDLMGDHATTGRFAHQHAEHMTNLRGHARRLLVSWTVNAAGRAVGLSDGVREVTP